MNTSALDDYLFLWRVILSIIAVLALPWVIGISKNVATLVAEVHALRQSVNSTKVHLSKKTEAQEKRLRTLELTSHEHEVRLKKSGR